ncbi:MAG: M50 family metallopeptidase [Defluviitaleaceae bacterium]|nr:M50 family metallopeptidase [Defluviitaleaceae bacterium]MCL2263865.1 M50 family metallopeptidase [Defluviitaleaceae bacterium]
MQTIIPILIFILILGIVIFVHELGHFMAARRAGIFVEEFALGMGPKLIGVHGKKESLDGQRTLFSLRAFPVGGFCKMRGMDDVTDDPEGLTNKSIPARALVMAGGSLMNFLLAFVLFFFIAMTFGYTDTRVRVVSEGSAGYHAGLMAGDRITHINGSRVQTYEDYAFLMSMYEGQTVTFRVNRGGERLELTITPLFDERFDRYIVGFNPVFLFGLADTLPETGDFRRVRIWEGAANAVGNLASHTTAPFRLLSRFIGGAPVPEDGGIMGPIGIGGFVTNIYQDLSVAVDDGVIEASDGFIIGFRWMVTLTAAISVMLGVMNLMPVPALDGARLVFLAVEAVRKKPIAPEREAMIHFVGLVSFLILAVFIAYRDIIRLFPGLD